jgi:hypothetical protein
VRVVPDPDQCPVLTIASGHLGLGRCMGSKGAGLPGDHHLVQELEQEEWAP